MIADMTRRAEIASIGRSWGEPVNALVRSALVAHQEGRLDAAMRIVSDLVVKRPGLRSCALIFALEDVELRFGGAVSICTPTYCPGGDECALGMVEHWGTFVMKTYPEEVRLGLALLSEGDGALTLHAPTSRGVGAFDPLAEKALRELACQIAAYLSAYVELERA